MEHGGNRYQHVVKLDFSVNINPLGVPATVREACLQALDRVSHYPDPRVSALRAAIAAQDGVSAESVLVGNGASELLMAIAQGLNRKHAILQAPSFYGYQHGMQAVGGSLRLFQEKMPEGQADDFLLGQGILSYLEAHRDWAELLFLTNPNNPTGRLIPRALIREIAKSCEEYGIILVLDECFLSLSDGAEDRITGQELAAFPHLIVLRAFTKSFGIPGLRLGYLLCHSRGLIEKIRRQLPEWSVSVIAQEAGLAACRERDFLRESRVFLGKERDYLSEALRTLLRTYDRQAVVYPSDTNFLLVKTRLPLYALLLARGILIRPCGNFPGLSEDFYRIAVRPREENQALLRTLRDVLSDQAE